MRLQTSEQHQNVYRGVSVWYLESDEAYQRFAAQHIEKKADYQISIPESLAPILPAVKSYRNHPEEKYTNRQIAALLNVHPNVVARAVSLLLASGEIQGRGQSRHTKRKKD